MLPDGKLHQEVVCHQDAHREADKPHGHLKEHYPPEACHNTQTSTLPHDPVIVRVNIGAVQEPADLAQDGLRLTSDRLQIYLADAGAELADHLELSLKVLVDVGDLRDVLLCSLSIARYRVVHVAFDVVSARVVGIRVRVCLISAHCHLHVAQCVFINVHAEHAEGDAHGELHRGDGRGDDDHDEEEQGGALEPAIHAVGESTAVEAARSYPLDQDQEADARH
mmetsp:Transcript_12239/g.34704  ORF Transcript_12239/g.34704 Transcript_12239/m.34704 type:complete len:223 (+) Transcript_12239:346-1014(+)